MRNLFVFFVVVFISVLGACASDNSSCTIVQNVDGTATITCPDGTRTTVGNGTNGADGKDGKDGVNGTNGVDGADGKDGVDGTSCNVVQDADGSATITCPDGTSATVGKPSGGPALLVSRAAVPVSGTFVRGDGHVPALGIALTTGPKDIKVNQLAVRLYGNTANAWMSPFGDQFAIASISSATLYSGVDVVGVPTTPGLADQGSDGYTPGADWYRVQFVGLGLTIPANSTMVLTLKVKLLNSMSATTYVAVDLVPSEDVVAEDSGGNVVTVSGSALNGTVSHNPMVTIVTSGALSVASEGNPEGGIVVAGSQMRLASKVRFTALREGYAVNRLTVINDATGPFDIPVDTVAVSSVAIRYSDINGVAQTKTGSLANGSVTFVGLGFYVPAGGVAFLEIFANVSYMSDVGETLSGKSYRLGLRDTGNTVSTFEAVGATSASTENDPAIAGGSTVDAFLVRKSIPTFGNVSGLSTTLVNGSNRIFGWTIAADNAGPIGFGRLKLWTFGDVTLSDLKLYRGSTLLQNVVLTQIGNAILATFAQEEVVGAGLVQTYYLDATVTGVVPGSRLGTQLMLEDGPVPLTLANSCSPKTGYVFGLGGTSLFANAADFVSTDVVGNELVWSDRSADAHAYPVLANGLVVAGSGSQDWTNSCGMRNAPMLGLILTM
jgi:hypothetical protein